MDLLRKNNDLEEQLRMMKTKFAALESRASSSPPIFFNARVALEHCRLRGTYYERAQRSGASLRHTWAAAIRVPTILHSFGSGSFVGAPAGRLHSDGSLPQTVHV